MPLVDLVWETLRAIAPVLVVRTQQQGVEFRGGAVQAAPLGPGLYWRCPYVREIELVSTAVQWVDLPVQGIVTADDRSIACSVNLAYRVVDPVRWHVHTQDAEHGVLNAIRPEVAAVMAAYDYDVLREHVPGVGRLLRARCRAALARIGARPVEVGLSDFIPARHYRLLQDTVVG